MKARHALFWPNLKPRGRSTGRRDARPSLRKALAPGLVLVAVHRVFSHCKHHITNKRSNPGLALSTMATAVMPYRNGMSMTGLPFRVDGRF